MRLLYAFALLVVGCHGDPVGETAVDGGKGGTTNVGGVGGAGGSAASSGSGGTAGSGATGGSTGGSAGIGGTSGSGGGGGVLVDGPDGALGLALDATDVYFGIGKDVWRAPKSGGQKQLVAAGSVLVREVVLSGSVVYFLDGDKTIRHAPAAGGNAELVVQGGGSFEEFGDIATDGTYVYFTTTTDKISFAGSVLRVPVGGGAPFEIHKVISAGEPRGIALLGNDVFWAQRRDGMLYKAPTTGGGATVLAQGLSEPWKVAPNATLVYWTELGGSLAYKKYGSNDIVVPAGGPGDDVVIDESSVYFSSPSAGKVYAAALESKTAVAIADCNLAGALALDETSLYIACGGDPGAVLKVAK